MPHRGETEAQAETRRLAFETRRDQSVLDRLYEVERDTPFDTTELYHVPYYHTLEEQNQFLNSIAHTQFGSTLLRIQERSTRDRVPMILPKFSNTRLEAITTSTVHDYTFPNITKKEEQFLIAMNLGISEDINGKYVTGTNKTKDFKDIVNGVFEYNDKSGIGVITDLSTSPGYRTNTLKYGYEEPEIITVDVDPYVPPTEKPFEKPPRVSVFQPAEPEITTDHIEPPAEEEPEIIISQVEPTIEEPEPQVTTSQVEPPGVEEPCPDWVRDHPELSCPTEVTTDRVDPPPLVEEIIDVYPQEVTAQISWFGDTWFPWHLELEDRRRR